MGADVRLLLTPLRNNNTVTDKICPMPRGRNPKTKRGGPQRLTTRNRRYKQSDSKLPRAIRWRHRGGKTRAKEPDQHQSS
jgi:hypothetical protein